MLMSRDVANGILEATLDYQGWITRCASGLADADGRMEITLEDVRRACLLHTPSCDLTREPRSTPANALKLTHREQATGTDDHWKCPKCSAPNDGHGKGPCKDTGGGSCQGLICECASEAERDDHGTEADPCAEAVCYHCGWGGELPEGMVKCPKCKGHGKIRLGK